MKRSREAELHRAAHLAAVDVGRHDGTEGADVEEIVAHPAREPAILLRLVLPLGRALLGVGVDLEGLIGPLVLLVEDGLLLDVDLVRGLLAVSDPDEVADLAFEADVGDEALAGLRVEAGKVACIGVAVGIAVGDVEEVDEVVAVADGGTIVR